MEGLLTPVRTVYKTLDLEREADLVEQREPQDVRPKSNALLPPATPAEALKLLQAEPDFEGLRLVLEYLANDASGFDIASPSPLAAQLIHALVSDIVPTYWNALQYSKNNVEPQKQGLSKDVSSIELLFFCLRSVTGLNAILLDLKQAIQQSKSRGSSKKIGGPNTADRIAVLLQLLSALLRGQETIAAISKRIWDASDARSKQKPIWNEFLCVVGGGKLIGVSAEAEDIVNQLSKDVQTNCWVSNGIQYSKWIAQNVSSWAKLISLESEIEWICCAAMLSKSLRLGYSENIIKELIRSLLLQPQQHFDTFQRLLAGLANFEQRNVVQATLKFIPREYLSSVVVSDDDSDWWRSDMEAVSATATLINVILCGQYSRKATVISWLTSASGAGVGEGIAIRRATIAALGTERADVEVIFDKSLQQFGDPLYIRHTSAIQQEVHTQVLLLAAGFVHRQAPLHLAMMMRSGTYLSAISNRLATSSPRARFLGMVVGEALSGLVDKEDKKMVFKVDEMNSSEAKWYTSLVAVSDSPGSLKVLLPGTLTKATKNVKPGVPRESQKFKVPRGTPKIVSIEEMDDDEDENYQSEYDGLIPYTKPDSDQEDSDEDATLITRNKPTAPVYIRDLITYLREKDSYDKQKLALQSAPTVIRRKVEFGTEVSSHAEELATLLVGLSDKYNIEKFQEMRLQGMIAILIASPLGMGRWFSKTFFDGDYSLSQRASILTTIGLGARELGGFGSEDSSLTSNKSLPSSSFPSRTLPDKMHRLYANTASESTPLDRLSTQLSNTMIAPMAADLADELTGPSILKVRTFSSRMAVEKKRKRPIANSLAKVVAEGFFFPLTGRFFTHLKAFGGGRSNIVFQPYLLTLFIKTLSLLLHASGPSTLSLPQMTAEFWDLLLNLRTQSIGDITVVEALLFAFLTLLDINEDKRRLVEVHGRQLLETQEWVEGVCGWVGAGGSEEDDKVRMLAAGCLVRIREVVEKYQSLLIGDLASFQN